MRSSIQASVVSKLSAGLSPVHLDVQNESHLHNVPPGSESHFKVLVVSAQFAGRPLLEQQRMVNRLLAEELAGGIHALSIKTLTPEQWERAGGRVSHETPLCRGGDKPA